VKKKIKLLFVDDEPKFLSRMSERLRLRDLVVHSFGNGADALEAIKNETYDVALIDLKMPGMRGEELLEKIKALVPATEVVILTGHGSFESVEKTFRAGAYEYLLKPCELDDLISAITRAYARRVKARNEALTAKANSIIAASEGYQPRELLRMLEELEEDAE
jgi:DNA-binding NtrC family response regulator